MNSPAAALELAAANGAPTTLPGWADLAAAFLSRDLKTGPVAAGPGRASDSVRNTTWLPSGLPEDGGTCAGASPGCYRDPVTGKLICYARRLELGRGMALGKLVDHRLQVWQNLELPDLMTLCSSIILETVRMQTQPARTSTHHGHPVQRPTLRIGGGGDLTADAGQAWAAALHWAGLRFPTFRAWLYSRAYGLTTGPDPLEPLAAALNTGHVHNLAAYLSTDPSMVDRTRRALAPGSVYERLPVAVLADTTDQGAAILDDLGRPPARRLVCPTERTTHTWPLALRRPRAPGRPAEPFHQGACSRCRACIEPAGTRTWTSDIIFIRR